MTAARAALVRAANRLVVRLADLETRLDAGDDVWSAYAATVEHLVRLDQHLASVGLLTTQEMADRLAIAPKTLLRRKKKGQIRPAFQHGRLS